MKIILITFLSLFTVNCFSQSIDDLNKINSKAQICADTAIDVVGCELLHYKKTDSLLNLAYNKLKC
jgi:hypothetical protein